MSPQPITSYPAIAEAEAAKYLGIRQDAQDTRPVTFVSHSNRKHAVSAKQQKRKGKRK